MHLVLRARGIHSSKQAFDTKRPRVARRIETRPEGSIALKRESKLEEGSIMFPLGGLDNLLDAPRASKSRRKAEGGNGQQISAVAAGSTSFVEMDGAADEEDESDRAPRPPNSWILYRSAKSQEIKRDMEESGAWASSPPVSSRQRQAEISRTVSMMWKNEAKEVKDMYSAMAEERRLGHRQRYPVSCPQKSFCQDGGIEYSTDPL
ncbi:hypothetical protein K437DRAFT_66818 [Tilletiaria anomala UBC 951]|uniref:HMG box domain-containing protein n=1 Tax=Tilletiaria anomala (strain ATCC 24038 / CBS 436.72 / UBC 951) TaxID=1037660 RepID=A0A066WD12_TILAU|nr:uncharacterized protein K437DRAFT_66818 [Tilletiaria anomala UBC 951]KDN50408.1 hypothetical protein K437DRAFT_66818 [Tilletiaria anomala UBC 951]